MECFKGIIWPRDRVDGLYRYVVVGMVVSNTPIEEFEGKNELFLAGESSLADPLVRIRHRESDFKGDATNVLLSLRDMNFEDDTWG